MPVISSGPSVEDTLSFEIWVDIDMPLISNALPQAGSLTANSRIAISCLLSDQDSGLNISATNLTLNGSTVIYVYDVAKGRLEFTPGSALNEGTNAVFLTAYDQVGNYLTKGWDFLVDTQPPSGGIMINNGAASTISAHVLINIDADDTISGVGKIYLSNDGVFDTELNQPYSYKPIITDWTLHEPDIDGLKSVYLKLEDNAGNLSQTYSDTIELKLLTPDTKIISGPASTTAETTASFRFEATKLNCRFSYKLDGEEWSVWSDLQNADFSILGIGNHYFYVKSALDLNGDGEFTADEEDPTPAQWVWTITTEEEVGKLKRKTLFWRR
jgi:hypothetical protein